MPEKKLGIEITGTTSGRFIPFTQLDPSSIECRLLLRALEVRRNAYAPVTDICVGSAIESSNGNVFIGCNVENATLSQTIHAEENAIGTMIANGDKKPVRIAIAVAKRDVAFNTKDEAPTPESLTLDDFPPTCPQCLQIIWQHCQDDRDVELISITPDGGVYMTTMGTALTMPFRDKFLS